VTDRSFDLGEITVVFSSGMDVASVEEGFGVIVVMPGIGYGKVAGEVNMDDSGRTARFIPTANLVSGLNYRVAITDARDTEGNSLTNYEWSYVAPDTPAELTELEGTWKEECYFQESRLGVGDYIRLFRRQKCDHSLTVLGFRLHVRSDNGAKHGNFHVG